MIKGVIFDVDGVLLDSMSAWENLGQMYLKHLGISAEADLGEILSPMSLEEAARYLIDHYGLRWKPEEVVRGINQELKAFYEHQVLLKPGVEIYVNEFCRRNIPMAIATSGDRENAEAALDRLGVLSYFEGICTCSETGWGKAVRTSTLRQSVFFIRIQKKHGFLRMRSMPYGQQKGLDFRQSGCTTGQMKRSGKDPEGGGSLPDRLGTF